MDETIAYCNGRYLATAEVAISLSDAGFVLGATVSEQLRTFGGELFRLQEHLARLARSLEIVGVEPVETLDELATIATTIARRNHDTLAEGDDLGVSILVTPGAYATFSGGEARRPTVIVHAYLLPFGLWADAYESGVPLAIPSVRQTPIDCWPAELKCRSRMHYYLADREARAKHPGARALLLDHDGFVTETATANLVVWREGEGLITPPMHKVLPGVSLGFVRELAAHLDIAFAERDLRPEDVQSADEAILTSTPSCILPVSSLNGQPIGAGRAGEIFNRLLAAWSEAVGVDIAEQARAFAVRNHSPHAPLTSVAPTAQRGS